jgi:hypothetical protein
LTSCSDNPNDQGLGGLNITMGSKGIQSITNISDQSAVSFKFNQTLITQISSNNNTITENVTYGANGKITNVVRTSNNGGVSTDYSLNLTNANGQLTHIDGTETVGSVLFHVAADFTYNASGKLVKTFISKQSTNVAGLSKTIEMNYTYSGDNISSKDVAYLDTANGVTTSTGKKYDYSNYDGNINPFGRFPYDYKIYASYFENGLDTISPNNYSTVTITGVGQPSSSRSFVYTYNNDGTPLTKNENGVIYMYAYQNL